MLTNKLNSVISKWKGHEYRIDPNIPTSHLLKLAIIRFLMQVYGAVSGVKNKRHFFLSFSAKIRCRSRLRVGHSVTIEQNVYINALSADGITLGNNVSIGRNTRIEGTGSLKHLGKGLKTGHNVGLGADCFYGCAGGITIGDDTIVGNYVSFHSENHVFEKPDRPIHLQGVSHQGIVIGKNCWIGAKATILDGVVLQDGSVVAAGAVLTAGVYAANGIYGGVPAVFIKPRCNHS